MSTSVINFTVGITNGTVTVSVGTGLQGPPGPQGPAGSGSGDLNYVHNQTISSSTWTINHNLNKYPSVTVQDSAGDTVRGILAYTNLNTVTLTFSAAYTGIAYLN